VSEAPKVPAQEPEAPAQAPDYAGFNSPEELAKAYRASSSEARNQAQRAQVLEQQLMQQFQPQKPAATPYDRLSEWGLPVDALREAVRSEIAQELQPIARAAGARNQVIANYPDYVKYEQDVMGFINGDPELQRTYNSMFQGDPVGTAEWAFLKFGEKQRRAQPAANGANPSEKAHAQIPSSRTGETRAQKDSGQDDEIAGVFKRWQETGDPRYREEFARRRIRQVVSQDFLDKNR
jgi:hypothetical protein